MFLYSLPDIPVFAATNQTKRLSVIVKGSHPNFDNEHLTMKNITNTK